MNFSWASFCFQNHKQKNLPTPNYCFWFLMHRLCVAFKRPLCRMTVSSGSMSDLEWTGVRWAWLFTHLNKGSLLKENQEVKKWLILWKSLSQHTQLHFPGKTDGHPFKCSPCLGRLLLLYIIHAYFRTHIRVFASSFVIQFGILFYCH